MINYIDFDMTKVAKDFKKLFRTMILEEENFDQVDSITIKEALALELVSHFSVNALAKQAKAEEDPMRKKFFEKAMRYAKAKQSKEE